MFSRLRIRWWIKRRGPTYAERRLRRRGHSRKEAKRLIWEAKNAGR